MHTRTAQLQDKVEQQQLKKLVLDYEQREGVEELKGKLTPEYMLPISSISMLLLEALEDTLRNRGMKVKHQQVT